MAGTRNLGGRNGYLSHVRGDANNGGVSIGDDATTVIAFHGAVGDVQRAYTIANHTDDRALNETTDTLVQVANVLGTLLKDLQAKGIIG